MLKRTKAPFAKVLAASTVGLGLLHATPVLAQGSDSASQNVTINLIRLLVKQGVISQKAADALLKEAEQEAAQAKKTRQQPVQAAAAPSVETPPPAGTVRVPYVPEIVKNQIRDEVKKEVLQTAREENWAQPEMLPAWTKHFKLFADFRFRDENDLFSSNNDPGIIDYASFNANGPTDIRSFTNPNGIPFLNTTADRLDRLSIRARLGVDATITDGVKFGLRLASGGDNGPVSTTQLLGGGFGKKDFWLDQAYLNINPSHWIDATVGRMPNPFVHTDLVYDPDLNFDGAAISTATKRDDAKGIGFFATEGMFPIGYIGNNFPDHGTDTSGIPVGKRNDHTKWLWGNQIGVDWDTKSFDWRFAGSYYDFSSIQGQLSTLCPTYLGAKECSTDFTRPAFMQKGNTLFLIRQLAVDPKNPESSQPQFAGLAFKYKLVNATSEFTMPVGKYQLLFDFDYVHNLAYHWTVACRYGLLSPPITNVEGGNFNVCDDRKGNNAVLKSGPDGWYVTTTFGDSKPRTPWAWNVSVGYKYLEPDAVPDGFTDSDFHLGGTNARGFIVGGSLGLFDNTWLTARWLSANEVYGPPMAIDVVQLDLNAGL
jgi:hypothetical protein